MRAEGSRDLGLWLLSQPRTFITALGPGTRLVTEGQGHPGTVRDRQDNRSNAAEMLPEKPGAGAGPTPCRFTAVQEAGGVCWQDPARER